MCVVGLIEGLVVLEESLGLGVKAEEPQSAGVEYNFSRGRLRVERRDPRGNEQ